MSRTCDRRAVGAWEIERRACRPRPKLRVCPFARRPLAGTRPPPATRRTHPTAGARPRARWVAWSTPVQLHRTVLEGPSLEGRAQGSRTTRHELGDRPAARRTPRSRRAAPIRRSRPPHGSPRRMKRRACRGAGSARWRRPRCLSRRRRRRGDRPSAAARSSMRLRARCRVARRRCIRRPGRIRCCFCRRRPSRDRARRRAWPARLARPRRRVSARRRRGRTDRARALLCRRCPCSPRMCLRHTRESTRSGSRSPRRL